MNGQINLLDEIIVDNFAGGGGASTGIELATGRVVNIAINHDPDAILMHRKNHPFTEHLQASVWDVDPVEVCAGRPVGLAWFSPDCKHFSKAKGGALVDRKIRGLAWIVLRWAARVRPRVIILENVEEFTTWGPVRKGKPVKSKSGQTFRKWLIQLIDLGYDVDYRELVAADYGAPTTRKRFVLVARCDGKPIRWPERTHAPRDSEGVKSGKCLPWRSAAEIIDWTVPMYSVFASKEEIKARYLADVRRPLKDNTMRRIIRGVDKFTIKNGNPFIVYDNPVRPFIFEGNHTGGDRVSHIGKPIGTITRRCTIGVAAPKLAPVTLPNTCNSIGSPANAPVHTITSAGNQILAAASLMSIGQTGGGDRIRDITDPTPTTVSKQEACLVTANLIQYHTEQTENVRANGLDDPLPTVDASNRYGLTAVCLTEYYGNGNPLDISEPMHTATAHDREALTAAHIVEFKGQDIGQHLENPLRTITASAGEFAIAAVRTAKYDQGVDLGYWPEIRALLNRYCGYDLADDEVLLLWICGSWHYINDIAMRMLTPKELYAAMGFPADYIFDFIDPSTGKPYPKSAQVARCGNAVCPPMATAVVRANMPEWCQVTYVDMSALMRAVAT